VIEEHDGFSELPHGWAQTQLGEIAEIVLGQSPPSSTYNEDRKGLPFYQGKLEFGRSYPTPRKWCMSPKKTAEKGDVLISVRAPVGPTNICPEKSCIGRGLAAIRGLGGIGTFFILYLLRTFETEIARKGTGTTFSAIGGDQLKELEIPLPPLAEQVRIVARLEELFARLDAGVEGLRKVKAQLKRYRQAVLKYAFEGKLTEEWRKTHKHEIELATKLLEQTKQETKRGMQESRNLEQPMTSVSLPELPETWVWVAIDELQTFIGSGITPRGGRRVYVSKGIPFIRSQNVHPDGLHLEDIVYITREQHIEMERTQTQPNDVLLNITGASIGRSAHIPQELPEANVNQHVCIIRTGWGIAPAYLSRFLNSPWGQDQIFSIQSGVTRQGLNYAQVRNLRIPLAPLPEQEYVVAKIEETLSSAYEIEKTINRGLAHAERLRQGILKQAFEGKLAPQDASDEPAEKMLARIREERAKSKGEKDTNRRKKNNLKQLELSSCVE
jgi:type I restriction enzyme S subunit